MVVSNPLLDRVKTCYAVLSCVQCSLSCVGMVEKQEDDFLRMAYEFLKIMTVKNHTGKRD